MQHQLQTKNFFGNFIKVALDFNDEGHVNLFETLSFLERLYMSADDLQLTELKSLIDKSKELNNNITIVVTKGIIPRAHWDCDEKIIRIDTSTDIYARLSQGYQELYELEKKLIELEKLLGKAEQVEGPLPRTPKYLYLETILHELSNSANELFSDRKYSTTKKIMGSIYDICTFSPGGTYLVYNAIKAKEPQFEKKLKQQSFMQSTKYIYEYAEHYSTKQKTAVINQINENFTRISSQLQQHEVIPVPKMREETFEECWENSNIPDPETGVSHASHYRRTCSIM